jgi:hypothetical protein
MTITCPAAVKLATSKDAEELVDLLIENHRENGLASLNLESLWEAIVRGCERQDAMIGIIRGPKRIEASAGLYRGPWWFSREQHWIDYWNFVHPDHRKTTHAKMLLEFANWVGSQFSEPVFMGVLSDHRTEAKMKLYGRKLRLVGGTFVAGPVKKSGAAEAHG